MLEARVIATRTYEKRIAKLLSPEERTEVENAVATDPERYPVVPGTYKGRLQGAVVAPGGWEKAAVSG